MVNIPQKAILESISEWTPEQANRLKENLRHLALAGFLSAARVNAYIRFIEEHTRDK